MGGVKDFLFGKKAKGGENESGNHAWDSIKSSFSPALGYVTQGGNAIGNILGLNGGAAQTAGLDNFANSGGMQFLMDSMAKGVTSTKAAQGLLESGSYGTALQDRAYGLGSTYLNQYLDNAFKLANLGLGAGGTMASAGQWSKGTGATQGKQGALPGLISAAATAGAFSDRRVKTNITPVSDGLYEFEYRQDLGVKMPEGLFLGYMADELPEEALGPVVNGFQTVKEEYRPQRIF